MDNKKRVEKRNPISNINFISNLFFWYTKDIFWKSNHRNITSDDIYDPIHTEKSDYLGNLLEKEWNHELEKFKKIKYTVNYKGKKISKITQPSLSKALIRMFFWQNIVLSVMQAVNFLVLVVCYPLFQGMVINYFKVDVSGKTDERNRAFLNATIMILTKLITVLLEQHAYKLSCTMGMRARVACCSLMYRKILRLHKSILNQTAAGQVINLMSNDVSRLDIIFQFINFMWITPIQVILILYIMWDSIGIVLLVGISILLLIAIPFQSVVTYTSKILRLKIAILTDKRVQLMSELISGIKVIKMYAWEKPFNKIVNNIRLAEMKKITTTSHVRSIFFSSMVYTERITLFVTLILFVFAGNHLTAEISFVLATYFNILQLTIIYMMPNALIAAGEVSVSIKRIEEFLLLDEITISKVSKLSEKNVLEDDLKFLEKKNNDAGNKNSSTLIEVNFHRVSANWIIGQLPPTLNDLTFDIKAGSLCALAGNVGSGKTAILQLFLRELQVGAGSIILRQQCNKKLEVFQRSGFYVDIDNLRISYASQDAWLFASTIRENILFGEAFDAARYNEVIEVCALKRDLEQLSKGDLSTVGERGSSLSGGQRARINLARAIYRQADIYLLDDPLSAVDPKVACHLFERCIKGFLHDKTRILVIHQLQFLQHVDTIIFIERGSIKYQGSYKNITNINPNIMDMLDKIKNEDVNKNTNTKNMTIPFENTDSTNHSNEQSSIKSFNSAEVESIATSVNNEEINRIYSNFTLFKTYLRAGSSWCLLGLYVIVLILTQIATSATDYWLGYWTNMEDKRSSIRNTLIPSFNMTYNASINFENFSEFSVSTKENNLLTTEEAISVYATILGICIFLCVARSYLIIKICMKASQRLHKLMFSNILHSTMNFFNKNPSGRIMNRFSKDTGAMDELLSRNYMEAIQIFSIMIGILTVIVIVNNWMIITIVIVLITFWFAKKIYLNTAQSIKRIETAAKSPVFSHINATLNGLITIRSCGKQIENRLVMEFDRYQDEHSGTWYMIIITAAAFGMVLDFILILLNAVIAYSFIFINGGNILGGDVGLALSQASILTGMVQYGFRLFVEVMSQLTSVEKIVQYTNLPKEHPLTSLVSLPKNWPEYGRILMKNVSMRYEKNEPFVLKELNVEIEPGWKVGIIGRTGAGKSSMIAALFRLTGEDLKGEIIIDGIDTSQIGLQDLRARISIIPQEPVLFSQNLRYNLDPMGQYDDSVLWEALLQVELNDLSLDQQITEKGSNLSVGQRQLICLARAIIRQNLILVLDEATANIDAHTDAIIQNTIRKRFAGCTVLTVAHRLNTIIDSDRVIVMDNGSIVEFGCPYELLTNNMNGYFFHMVNQAGKTLSKKLETLAKEAYLQNMQHNFHISEDNVNNVQAAIQSEENYDIRL